MPYEFVSFDGVDIPRWNRESDLSTGEAVSGFIPTVHGGFSSFGSAESPIRLPIPIACNGWIVEASPGLTAAAFHSLRSRHRAVGTLIRRSDTGLNQRCEARLMHIGQNRGRQNHNRIEYNLQFEGYTEWRGTSRWHVRNLTSSPVTFETINNGNRTVTDAVLIVEAGADTITQLTVTVAGVTSIRWNTGAGLSTALLPGETLTWRMGAKSLKRSTGADEYRGFQLLAGHSIDDWLHIPPGGVEVQLAYVKSVSSGSGSARLEYYEGWK